MVVPRPTHNEGDSHALREWRKAVTAAFYPPELSYTPTITPSGSMTFTSVSINTAKYWDYGHKVDLILDVHGTTGGTANTTLSFTLPFEASSDYTALACEVILGAGTLFRGVCDIRNTSGRVLIDSATNFSLGTVRGFRVAGWYPKKRF